MSAASDESHAATDLGPRVVAGEHPVCPDLIRCGKDERVRKANALRSAAKTRRRSGNRRRNRFDPSGEVFEERFDLSHGLCSLAVRPNQDLGVNGSRNDKLVVLVLGQRTHGRLVQRIVRVEERDDDRCVEDDYRHSSRRWSSSPRS